MQKVQILRGIPGSGKSTYAKKLVDGGNWTRINKDDLRAMLHNGQHSKGKENLILDIRDSIMIKALRRGHNVVIDDTNLEFKHIERISEVVEAQAQIDSKDYKWEVKDFEIGLHEAIARDVKREKSVGEKVIRQMWNKYIRPKLNIDLSNKDLPDAVIFDIDGTLALLNGRSPYDASSAEYDLPNHPVIDALHQYQEDGYKIIVTSGRHDTYLPQTEKWFEKNNIKPDVLIMRKEGDVREDSIVKREMFMNNIYGKYNVEVVYDDRMRVVDMWRDLGLNVFQVNEGNF